MHTNLKTISELVAKANDLFYSKFSEIDTLMGIMDKTLRKQGMNADAITIDCIGLDKKIVILIHDDKPESVEIALGNKLGEIHSSASYPITNISTQSMVDIMENYFTSTKPS